MPHKEPRQNVPKRQQPPPSRPGRQQPGQSSPRREAQEGRASGVAPEEEIDYDQIEEELLADEAESVDEEDAGLAGAGASSPRRSGDVGEEEEEEEEAFDSERASRGRRDDVQPRRH